MSSSAVFLNCPPTIPHTIWRRSSSSRCVGDGGRRGRHTATVDYARPARYLSHRPHRPHFHRAPPLRHALPRHLLTPSPGRSRATPPPCPSPRCRTLHTSNTPCSSRTSFPHTGTSPHRACATSASPSCQSCWATLCTASSPSPPPRSTSLRPAPDAARAPHGRQHRAPHPLGRLARRPPCACVLHPPRRGPALDACDVVRPIPADADAGDSRTAIHLRHLHRLSLLWPAALDITPLFRLLDLPALSTSASNPSPAP